MVGFYPDNTSYRLPYDQDGTRVFAYNSAGGITEQSDAIVRNLNSEESVIVQYSGSFVGMIFIFPRLMNIYQAFIPHYASLPSFTPSYSTNSTNGIDGTWTNCPTVVRPTLPFLNTKPFMRQSAYRTNVLALGCRALKLPIQYPPQWPLHLYGEIVSLSGDRLALWHPTLNQEIGPAYFDFGDVKAGTTSNKTFRVKNLSAGMTAGSIQVSRETLTESNESATSPTIASQFTFTQDGSSYFSTLNLPSSLSPGGVSSVITVRRQTPLDAQLSLFTARIVASASSWSA